MHSLLIPHRNRNAHLRVCLASIARSARICGIDDYEVIVADNGSREVPIGGGRVQVVRDRSEMPVFNKPRCYNVAIDAATGDVLTFLDADAIVGPRFLEAWRVLEDTTIIRCCYRVRYLPIPKSLALQAVPDAELDAAITALWQNYDYGYRIAYEAYGDPNGRYTDGTGREPWGNSQFSVTRKTLADLRPCEDYPGHGFEDLEFLRQFFQRYGNYRGKIWIDADHAILHQEHGIDPNWSEPEWNRQNGRRYWKR